MTKKAMSPLFSTIILIGFAIALGGILMSWGRSDYAKSSAPECRQASLSLVSYGESKGICSKESKLYLTVYNNGEIDLGGVKLSALGSDRVYSNVINSQINVGDIVKLEAEYQNIVKLDKVIFIPRFSYLGRDVLCPKNGFSVEDISEC